MRSAGALVLVLLAACAPPVPGPAAPRATPMPGGWYCFEDEAGSLCERSLDACMAAEADVGFCPRGCRVVEVVHCAAYVDGAGHAQKVCVASPDECGRIAAYMHVLAAAGAPIDAASITPCAATR